MRLLAGNCLFLFCESSANLLSRPHRGIGRKIHRGQRIHYSVFGVLERKGGYTPKASLPGLHWNDLREHSAEWVQHDLYSKIRSVFENPADGNGDDLRKTFDGLKDLRKPCRFSDFPTDRKSVV